MQSVEDRLPGVTFVQERSWPKIHGVIRGLSVTTRKRASVPRPPPVQGYAAVVDDPEVGDEEPVDDEELVLVNVVPVPLVVEEVTGAI